MEARDETSTTLGLAPESEEGAERLRTRLVLWLGVTAVLALSFDLSGNIAGVLAIHRTWSAQLAHPGNWAIGEGGMGIVYRARHAFLRRPTAIKLLPASRAGVVSLRRFEREVLQTSRLTHPNTVAIYDYGRTAHGIFYYAMEYLDGLSLEQLGQHDGPQPPGRVVHLLSQACGALAEAHRRGLIHRDVKPANLYLCVRGDIADHVKVLDFGLVKELDTTDPGLSSAGSFLGSPLYMAPEAITKPHDIDGRADIYALGAVGYFLLTQTPPFSGKSLVQICTKHIHEVPEPPSKRLGRPVPASLEALLLRCLEKRPDGRPEDAVALSNALLACDVEPWTSAHAEEWWKERGPNVIERSLKPRTNDASPTGERSVAVALDDRSLGPTVPL